MKIKVLTYTLITLITVSIWYFIIIYKPVLTIIPVLWSILMVLYVFNPSNTHIDEVKEEDTS
mgnify:CR=1 FL=1